MTVIGGNAAFANSPDGKMGAKCMHDPSFDWQDFKAVLGDPREFYKPQNTKS